VAIAYALLNLFFLDHPLFHDLFKCCFIAGNFVELNQRQEGTNIDPSSLYTSSAFGASFCVNLSQIGCCYLEAYLLAG
jgi:hypothetical protein